jgi:hypothetical protein
MKARILPIPSESQEGRKATGPERRNLPIVQEKMTPDLSEKASVQYDSNRSVLCPRCAQFVSKYRPGALGSVGRVNSSRSCPPAFELLFFASDNRLYRKYIHDIN